MGLFRQIKDLHSESAPVVGTAQVLAVRSQRLEGAPGVEVSLLITAPGRDPCETVTVFRVSSGHVADVVPGAVFPVWVEVVDRGDVVVAWDD